MFKRMTPDELKNHEMNAQTQFVVDKYQEIANQVDSFRNDFKQVVNSHNFVFSKLDSHSSGLVALSLDVEKMKGDLANAMTLISNNVINLNNFNKDICDKFTQLKDDFMNHVMDNSKILGNLHANISNNLRSVSENQEDLKSVKVGLSAIEDKFKGRITDLENSLQKLMPSHEELKNATISLTQDLSVVNSALRNLEPIVVTTLTDLLDHKSAYKVALDSMRALLEQFVKDQIASIPKPDVAPQQDNAAQIKSITEPLALDSKNANIRSQNNEAKITLLEKRIEQLQLMMSKLQLSG